MWGCKCVWTFVTVFVDLRDLEKVLLSMPKDPQIL